MNLLHPYTHRTFITTLMWPVLVLFPLVIVSLTSCSDKDDEPFPSMVTELADAITDDRGQIAYLWMDDSTQLRVSNSITGFHPRAGYRCLCGFVRGGGNSVELLSLSPAYVLYDCQKETFRAKDPLGVVSVWRGGHRYLNMYLRPKTRGGSQLWGYLRDSVYANTMGGSTYCLSLLHGQGTDTLAYSQDYYMSIPLDSITPAFGRGDSIRLSVATWSGLRTYSVSAR